MSDNRAETTLDDLMDKINEVEGNMVRFFFVVKQKLDRIEKELKTNPIWEK